MRLKQIGYEHPAWIICTPEYNASYPALLKNTLDWLSSPVKSDPVWNDDMRSTRGKVVGMLSASPGALGGMRSQSHLVPLLLNLSAGSRRKNYALGRAADAFDATGNWSTSSTHQGPGGDRPGAVGRRPSCDPASSPS